MAIALEGMHWLAFFGWGCDIWEHRVTAEGTIGTDGEMRERASHDGEALLVSSLSAGSGYPARVFCSAWKTFSADKGRSLRRMPKAS
jgi:hypothetical protein